MTSHPLGVNWCASCGHGSNFGDQLTPALLTHYGIRHVFAKPITADLFAVGSIATKIPTSFTGYLFGTGLIRDTVRPIPRARALAVRGPLTAERLKLRRTPHPDYGDPGILVPDLLPTPSGRISGGPLVIPHYVDRDLAMSAGGFVVDITSPVLEVLDRVASATIVHTSSLHALIAADAYGIPHVWHPHPGVIGDGFKFRDYAAGLDTTITPGVERLTPRANMLEAQDRLRAHVDTLRTLSRP